MEESEGDLTSLRKANVFGIAATAALTSSQPKKGAHRCHVASSTLDETLVYSLNLDKTLGRSRDEEDWLCSRLIVDAISERSGIEVIDQSTTQMYLSEHGSDTLQKQIIAERVLSNPLDNLYNRHCSHVFIYRGECTSSSSSTSSADQASPNFRFVENLTIPKGTFVYPGSFNPLHEGHVSLVCSALKCATGWESGKGVNPLVVFEIAAINADKPPIDRDEIMRRIQQFDEENSPMLRESGLTNIAVCITSEPLFVSKSTLFPGCIFLIGADTLARLTNPKYYVSNASSTTSNEDLTSSYSLVAALTTIKDKGCNFIVGGRKGHDNDFDTLSSVFSRSDNIAKHLPQSLLGIFKGLTEDEFRLDLSSTEIRNLNH